MSTVHNDSNSKVYQSVTNYLNEVATAKLTVNKEDGKVKTVAKIAANEVASLGLTVVGLVETVVRNVLAVIVKLATIIVPKQLAETLDQKVIKPLFNQAGLTAAATAEAASKLVTNFMSQETRNTVHTAIDNGIAKAYLSNALNAFETLHINGFSASDATRKAAADAEAYATAYPSDIFSTCQTKEESDKAAAETAAYVAAYPANVFSGCQTETEARRAQYSRFNPYRYFA